MRIENETCALEASDCDLSGSVFRDVNLSGSAFHDVNLSEITVDNANLAGSRFVDCNLLGATIEGVPVSALFAAYLAQSGQEQPDGPQT
jgi:uncharacterized protein YjbI with pentapeptide repeats